MSSAPAAPWKTLAIACLLALPGRALAQNEGVDSSFELDLLVFPKEAPFLYGVGSFQTHSLYAEYRYGYEAPKTLSTFVGWVFEGGRGLHFRLTPLLGLAAGEANGVIPGLEVDLDFWRLSFHSESEWLIDVSGEGSFIYTWTELSFRVWPWLQPGLAVQRTLTAPNQLLVNPGLMVSGELGPVTIGLYVFNPGRSDWYGLLSAGAEFSGQ